MSFARRASPGSDRRKKTLGPRPTERPSSRIHGGRVVTGIVSVFLAVIVWIAFGRALGHEFVGYDDQRYVVQNPWVTNGLTLDGIQWAFTTCMPLTGIHLLRFRTHARIAALNLVPEFLQPTLNTTENRSVLIRCR